MSSSTLQGAILAHTEEFPCIEGMQQSYSFSLCCPDNNERMIIEIISEENQLLTYWEKAVSLLHAYGAFILCACVLCTVIAFQMSFRS